MIYSKPVVNIICNLIVDGYDLRAIGKVKGLPSKATMCRWLKDYRKVYFLDRYRNAKEIQHFIFADYIVDLAMQYGHKNMGQLGGRVHKLHLKQNAWAPTKMHQMIEDVSREISKHKGTYYFN